MQIQLDARVRTNDGHRAGEVRRAVWDPETNEIRAFVVGTGGLLGHDVVVSREVLERADRDRDEVVIALSKHELDSLERYEEHAYAPPPYGWLAPAAYHYPTAAYLFPVAPMVDPAVENEPRTERHAIARGMRVRDTAGNVIGRVAELRFDDETGELRAILVRPEHPAGGDALREIPADHVDVGGEGVQLIESAAESPTRE